MRALWWFFFGGGRHHFHQGLSHFTELGFVTARTRLCMLPKGSWLVLVACLYSVSDSVCSALLLLRACLVKCLFDNYFTTITRLFKSRGKKEESRKPWKRQRRSLMDEIFWESEFSWTCSIIIYLSSYPRSVCKPDIPLLCLDEL